MKKKKAIKKHIYSTRFVARVFVLNIPTFLILGFLVLKNDLSLQTAFLSFLGAFLVVGVIAAFVFNELENITNYFKNLSLGIETDAPRIGQGLFSPSRLLDSFLALKNSWSEQTLSDTTILENLPDPLIMMTEKGEIVFANHIAKDVFGENIIGKHFQSLSSNEEMERAITSIIQNKQAAQWFEMTYEEVSSYTFQVRIEHLPARTKSGAQIVCVMHDITPFKLFKRQQSDFFSNASHELKTPLSILSGVIETLQGPAKNDEAAREKFLKMMAEQTGRMTQLVQDLLTLSKSQKTTEEKHEDVILIEDLLKGVMEDLKIKAHSHHQTFSFNPIHTLPRFIGNHARLHQVFQNLIDNAIKYGEENSVITITTQLKNGFPQKYDYTGSQPPKQVISVSIHNTGNPIPTHSINRLFERFYRLDTLKSRQVEGTGLGLGIVQQIVREHDGMIHVTSSQEKGTAFTVYLPLEF